jgi:preprotein translocase subunit SecB
MEYSFQIKHFRLLECHFKLNTDFDAQKRKETYLSGDIQVQHKTGKNLVTVVLSINSNNPEQPFIFSVSIQGVFEFNRTPPTEKLKRIVNINCASIMFPFLREAIADLTHRALLPPVYMQPFNFEAAYNGLLQSQSAETVKRKKIKKKSP